MFYIYIFLFSSSSSKGELLGSLSKWLGTDVYLQCQEAILEGVKSNLERAPLSDSSLEEQAQFGHLAEKLGGGSSPEHVRDNGLNT